MMYASAWSWRYAPRKWESFENINKENKDRFQASDHHCLWVEIPL